MIFITWSSIFNVKACDSLVFVDMIFIIWSSIFNVKACDSVFFNIQCESLRLCSLLYSMWQLATFWCVIFWYFHCVDCGVWVFDYINVWIVVCEFPTTSLCGLWCVSFWLHHCVDCGVWVFDYITVCFVAYEFMTTSLCVLLCVNFRQHHSTFCGVSF